MPMKLNVGASRKVTDNNYGSRGASINVEMELDSSLVAEPAKLQDKIRQLFGVVRVSLAEELNANGHAPPTLPTNGHHAGPSPNGNGNGNGNGHSNGALPRETRARPVTTSQIKALHAIARSNDVNLGQFLYAGFGTYVAEDLTLQQASQAIDDLRAVGTATR